MTSQQWVLDAIKAERARQDRKWGAVNTRKDELERWMVILGEEYGEACRCVLEVHPLQQQIPGDWMFKLRKELIQVAAVAVALLEKLDPQEKPNAQD